MRQWTVWAMVLLLSGSAGIAAADTDWCYQYLQKAENDQAIESCTKDLQSGAYDGENRILASRLYYRGKAYFNKLGKRNYDKAISDLTRAIRLLPDTLSSNQLRSFYETRGSVFLWAGRYDQAIADYTKLLSFRERGAWELARGTAYWLKGDYTKAAADFTAGVTLDSRMGVTRDPSKNGADYMILANYVAPMYQERGDLYYTLGDYENAVADFTKAMELHSADEDSLRLQMWLALNKLSAQRAESYREELQKVVKKDRWPGIVAKYYLGGEGVTEKDVLDKARQDTDDSVIRQNLCEAYYYLGEARLMRGDGKGAEAFFKKSAAIETRYTSYQKYMAKVWLKRKGHKVAPAAPARRAQTSYRNFGRGLTKCGTSTGNLGSWH